MKKMVWLLITLLVAGMLSACTGDDNPQQETDSETPQQNEQPDQNEDDVNDTDDNQTNNNTDAEESEGNAEVELPKSKMLPITLEGMEEERQATLVEGSNFYVYLLDGYTLEQVEPGVEMISMDYDADYHAEIRLLSKETDMETFKNAQMESLSTFGDVEDLDPTEHFDSYYHDANLYLRAINQSDGAIIVMVQPVEDNLLQYTIRAPIGEASEGFDPSIWTMLKTIKLK